VAWFAFVVTFLAGLSIFIGWLNHYGNSATGWLGGGFLFIVAVQILTRLFSTAAAAWRRRNPADAIDLVAHPEPLTPLINVRL
jgi:hypothetical protein